MINIKINNKEFKVADGTSVLEAARQNGIEIPTMCYIAGLTNNPSCMVCLVKDLATGNLEPSCALPASDGMNIITDNDEIHHARKEALELLLSDHVGDCEAPCQPSCPAGMDIPLMNRYIHNQEYGKAIEVIKKDIAIPLILGHICPAPCEKACRRVQVDNAVSICNLKKHVALDDLNSANPYIPEIKKSSGKKVAIIGTGPAGLSCAYYLIAEGHGCSMFDKNELPGGTLRYDIPDEKLPKEHLDLEIDYLVKLGVDFKNNMVVTPELFNDTLRKEYDAIVFATGNFEGSNIQEFGFEETSFGIGANKKTFELTNNGIFACGNIIRSRRMAITSSAQGKVTATSVNDYLNGLTPSEAHRMFNSKFGKLQEPEYNEYLKESVPDNRIKEHSEFSNGQALIEAARCMHCDCRKPDTCMLRIYSDQYNVDRNNFAFSSRNMVRKFTEHQSIIFEPEKCIKCNICVEICESKKDKVGFTNIGRGMDMKINVPIGHSIGEIPDATAIECARNCPTAAISLKKI